MKVIYKYPIKLLSRQEIELPASWAVVNCADQRGQLVIWFEVDTSQGPVKVEVVIIPTGSELPHDFEDLIYVNTVMQADENLVWHIYVKELN